MKSGKFRCNAKRIGKLLVSYHMVWRGIDAYFICRAFQSLIVKISFQHHAFFFFVLPLGADGYDNLNYNVLRSVYKWSNRYEADFRDVAP